MTLENRMEQTGELSPEQITAIKHSLRIGVLLVNEHPEIANMYREGLTHPEIAEKLNVKVNYGARSDKVAKDSIYRAITGHAGGFDLDAYDGLIQDVDELVRLGYEHNIKHGSKVTELGLGIHGLTLEQRSEYGRKSAELGLGIHGTNPETGERYVVEGGRIGGRKLSELGLGIHSLTEEERREVRRKGALAKGLTPWEGEETESAYSLSLESEYQHQKGRQKGRSDNKKIAERLNEDYHGGGGIRNAESVSDKLYKYRKTLEK